jgi:transcriptional regulator with GAF, ATPase, and Fis domain
MTNKHMKGSLILMQALLVAIAVCLAVAWALEHEGSFEAWLGVATTLLVALELVRQFYPWDVQEVQEDADNQFLRHLEASGDLRDLLDRSLSELERVARTDYNQILLNNQSAHAGRLIAAADSMPRHKQRYRIASYDGLLGSVYSSGKTLNARDVRQLKGYFEAVPETRSEIVVPIKSEGLILGVINSESENADHFTNTIREQLEQLASALGHLLPRFGYDQRVPENEVPWVQKDAEIDIEDR